MNSATKRPDEHRRNTGIIKFRLGDEPLGLGPCNPESAVGHAWIEVADKGRWLARLGIVGAAATGRARRGACRKGI